MIPPHSSRDANWPKRGLKLRANNVLVCMVLAMVASQLVILVIGFHLPPGGRAGYNLAARRQDDVDSDGEEDMDSRASSPGYKNQEADGYEDNEADDNTYAESPREEEGQADLERFFDDHLGASERDGMDKENLPSNIIPIAIPLGNVSQVEPARVQAPPAFFGPSSNYKPETINQAPGSRQQEQALSQPTDIATSFIKLPDNKLIITRQSITRGPIYKGGLDVPRIPPIPEYLSSRRLVAKAEPASEEQEDNLHARGSDVVATENDDLDRVYVTKYTDRPFKIDALGGFDPEEDFRDASRDLEESSPRSKRRKRPRSGARSSEQESEAEEAPQKDISFNDPETDLLFNDASETDEVTFGPNDEHDLEAEMHAQAYQEPGKPTTNLNSRSGGNSQEAANEPKAYIRRSNNDNDNDEGNWVNDGVEDMEIPSQSHQDGVLAKAAREEELARRAAEAEEEAKQNDAQQNDDEANKQEDQDGERMANADYMRDDLVGLDEPDEAEGYI